MNQLISTKLIPFFKLVRFKNLLIVFITQFIFRYIGLRNVYLFDTIQPNLDLFHFFLLVLTTVFITAGGYVINDIFDHKIDLINKPEKTFVGNQFSEKEAFLIYGFITLIGGLIAIYLAYKMNEFPLLFLYPLSVSLLWSYSKVYKKKWLIGNLIVSFFCAFVALIVWIAERNSIIILEGIDNNLYQKTILFFIGFSLLAFFSTLIREVIKDLEDVEGDKILNCETIPIVSGYQFAHRFIKLNIIILISSFIAILIFFKEMNLSMSILVLLVFLGYYKIFFTLKNEQLPKNKYTELSKLAKILMLAALFLFFYGIFRLIK